MNQIFEILEQLENGKTLKAIVAEIESQAIRAILEKYSGNQVRASQKLGMIESTLRHKMKKYGIEPAKFFKRADEPRLLFWYDAGELFCNQRLFGMKAKRPDEPGKWFICDTLNQNGAETFARLLGGKLVKEKPNEQ